MTTRQATTNYRWRRAMWATRKRTASERRQAPPDTYSYMLHVETNYLLAKLTEVCNAQA